MKIIEKVKEFNAHAGPVYCLSQGRYAHTFFSGASDGFVAEWNLQTLEPEKFSIKLDSQVFQICYLQDKNILVIGLFNGHLHIVDVTGRQEIKNYKFPAKGIFAIYADTLQQKVYTGDAEGVFHVWNMNTWELELSLPLIQGKIRSIGKGGTDKQILVTGADGSVRVLENTFFNEIHTLHVNAVGVNDALYDDDFLLVAGKDAHLYTYSTQDYALCEKIPAHNYGIYKLVKWDEFWVTASRDKTLKLWTKNTLRDPIRIDFKGFKGHTNSVNDLLVTQWNNYLISCGDDRKIIVWKIEQH